MIVAATLGGTAVSLAAVGYLAATDPKRRRAFRLPPVARRHAGIGWAAVLVPGVWVAWLAGAGGLLVWFGAVTVTGWGLAALRPESGEAMRAMLMRSGAWVRHGVVGLAGRLRVVVAGIGALRAPGARADRIGLLEARVAALESELAALRGIGGEVRSGGVVVELAVPGRR